MSEQEGINLDDQGPAGSPSGGEKQPLSRKARLIIGIGAAVFICALGLALPFLLESKEPAALTITVFSDGWSEVVLKPGVETALNEYLASGSSAPGFPLRISASNADAADLSVDSGSFFTWGKPDYVANDKGMNYTTGSSDTVYWSPYDANKSLVSQCTLTVTARQNGTDAAKARLIIRQTGDTTYSITLLASE